MSPSNSVVAQARSTRPTRLAPASRASPHARRTRPAPRAPSASSASSKLRTFCTPMRPPSYPVRVVPLEDALDPDPPSSKAYALVLEIRDGTGKPVDGAKVEVVYDMPAMGGMYEMRANAAIEHNRAGRYRV